MREEHVDDVRREFVLAVDVKRASLTVLPR